MGKFLYDGRGRKTIGVHSPKSKHIRRAAVLATLSVIFFLGYLHFLSTSVSSFLVTKYLSAKETAQPSRVPSILVPIGNYRLHLHHWLVSSCALLAAFAVLGSCSFVFPSEMLYGTLSGIAFQGIYCYDDWHRIVKPRRLHDGDERCS
jgi:hypothetical protein